MKYKCAICGKEFDGYGNNPYPVIKDNNSKCCDKCNVKVVIPERIKLVVEKAKNVEK